MKITKTTTKDAGLKELGRRLAEQRKRLGHNQEELAHKAGIGVATLRRIEDGKDAQMSSWFKLMLAMNKAETLDALLPEEMISPMEEVTGRRRRRVSRSQPSAGQSPPVKWGDES